jgi:hypothetical protein
VGFQVLVKLSLQQRDMATGSIFVGNGTTITAHSTPTVNRGNVYIWLGETQELNNPEHGKKPAPAVWDFSQQHNGHIYYGTNGIKSVCCNYASANASDIIFDTGTRAASAITLDGNVNVYANSYVKYSQDEQQLEQEDLTPIAHTPTGSSALTGSALQTIATTSGVIKHLSGTHILANSNITLLPKYGEVLFAAEKLTKKILSLHNHPQTNRILKTAACLYHTTSAHGSYSTRQTREIWEISMRREHF